MDFQASSRKQGDAFERICNDIFTDLGFVLHGRKKLSTCGVEIDQVLRYGMGNEIWVEYKGSTNGNRPGLLRTDSMKKAIANGALIVQERGTIPYWVVSSHLPHRGASYAMGVRACSLGYIDRLIEVSELRTWSGVK